ncbi:MAG: baeRF3 domain-containing protein [Panacagrimonas sp.]
MLSATGFFRVFRLQRAVPELAVVADSFHTKPLRRFLQTVDRYQVLGLSRGKFQVFEGDRNALDEIKPSAGRARTISEVLGDDQSEPSQTSFSHGGGGGSNAAIHHGQGGKSDGNDVETERFFRSIDRAVLDQHSKPSGLPLILATLPEHDHLFRQLSHNPFLMEAGLHANPEGMAIDELRQRVWEVVEPQHRARQLAMAGAFSAAQSRGLGSDNLTQVAQAAAEGRVATLLIESGRQIAGRLDGASGRIVAGNLNHPQVDDLLDDLGELVEKMGGEVRVLPAARMPGSTGLAATYRH